MAKLKSSDNSIEPGTTLVEVVKARKLTEYWGRNILRLDLLIGNKQQAGYLVYRMPSHRNGYHLNPPARNIYEIAGCKDLKNRRMPPPSKIVGLHMLIDISPLRPRRPVDSEYSYTIKNERLTDDGTPSVHIETELARAEQQMLVHARRVDELREILRARSD